MHALHLFVITLILATEHLLLNDQCFYKFQYNVLAATLNNIAFTYKLLGESTMVNKDKKSIYFRKGLEIMEITNGLALKNEHTSSALMSIGIFHDRLGDLAKSERNIREIIKHYRTALTTYNKLYEFQQTYLCKEHIEVLKSFSLIGYTAKRLAIVLDKVDPNEASTCYQLALQIYGEIYEIQKSSFSKYDTVWKNLHNLAETYKMFGVFLMNKDVKQSRKYLQDALDIYEKLGEKDCKYLDQVPFVRSKLKFLI
uniref:Putative product n=1 Tax=Xenopsylla cheopis TaxID=163159 RepID=A0A6M2DVM1_XENCH